MAKETRKRKQDAAAGVTRRTSSAPLQRKLEELAALGRANDRQGFVAAFVPMDLTAEETAAYLEDLTSHPEAEGQWTNLVAEIGALAEGKVAKIEGDEVTSACFFFTHPLIPNCDREVAFQCKDGEWRAEA